MNPSNAGPTSTAVPQGISMPADAVAHAIQAMNPLEWAREACSAGYPDGAGEESELIHLRFLELRAHLDLESLFAGGVMDDG